MSRTSEEIETAGERRVSVVTDEMIDAGMAVLAEYDPVDGPAMDREFLRSVYSAMHRATGLIASASSPVGDTSGNRTTESK